MKETAFKNETGWVSCAGPGEDNKFAICIVQPPYTKPAKKTAMMIFSRAELYSYITRLKTMLDESVQ